MVVSFLLYPCNATIYCIIQDGFIEIQEYNILKSHILIGKALVKVLGLTETDKRHPAS